MILVRQLGLNWSDVIVGPPVPLHLQRMSYGNREDLPARVAGSNGEGVLVSDWPTMSSYIAYAVPEYAIECDGRLYRCGPPDDQHVQLFTRRDAAERWAALLGGVVVEVSQ